ncbi:MAG: AGE family epimerase/isomerase [Spirochaetota bacterium]|nr:AGE family epimerase/isomerase [Spirochaetota bacterium]
MKYFTHSLRIMGTVQKVNYDLLSFNVLCQSGDIFEVFVAQETYYQFISNLDELNRDRIPLAESTDNTQNKLKRYIQKDLLVAAYGIYQHHNDKIRFDARQITLFHNAKKGFLFEETHWWLTQITALADEWLLNLFGNDNHFDFTKYQTNLTYIGSKEKDSTQECATLSRLIYGLSSAYLMTGNNRYYLAARKGVEYQRDTFRTDSHDGSFVVWAYAYKDGKKILPSQFQDDRNTIPLYEQIYALAGLTQFYRITNDWETLDDIKRTVNFFNQIFYDNKYKGYFSHIDYATFEPDTPILGDNKNKKNWNSIGDHAPAYLINLLLAIANIKEDEFSDLYDICINMLKELADLITNKFPDPNPKIPYVQERFNWDWSADKNYKWQQDRAVIGHNLKIAWNLTRIYNFLQKKEYLDLAIKLGESMKIYGLDQIRGGWFDVVERNPKNDMPIEFTWHNRKAWWQQEQGILAYLILYGATQNADYLQLARESIAFWNMAYLDFEYGGVYFDVIDDGLPYAKDDRVKKGSHSQSGYHVFELNFLAQLYIRSFVTKTPFRLYFRPCSSRKNKVFNVMPDYLPKNTLKMGKVYVDGVLHNKIDTKNFQIDFSEIELGKELEVAVEFIPV